MGKVRDLQGIVILRFCESAGLVVDMKNRRNRCPGDSQDIWFSSDGANLDDSILGYGVRPYLESQLCGEV